MTDAAALLAELLPLAVAVAASPFAIIPAVLLLLGPRPRATTSGFLVGWALGVLAVAAVGTLLTEVVDRYADPPLWATWARIGLGTTLLVLAVRRWRARAATTEQPAWLRTLAQATPGSAVRTGATLSAANPKVMLLAAAAGVAVGSADLSATGAVAVLAGFTTLACVSVAAPLLLHVVAGPRALAPLERARDWLERHQAAVVSVVLAAVGLLLLTEGVASLRT